MERHHICQNLNARFRATPTRRAWALAMRENPYSVAAARWAMIALGIVGLSGAGILVITTLVKGSTSGCFTRNCISTRVWSAASDPTQFWFYVFFWSAAAILMGRMAWKAWRDG
jgi:hypothetical protein